MTRLHRLTIAAAAISMLTLGGCAGGNDAQPPTRSAAPDSQPRASGGPTTPPAATTHPASAPSQNSAQAFCAELKANGATGASFGPIPFFYPQDLLLKDLRTKLADMGDAVPPKEIADDWRRQKTQVKKVEKAAKRMRPGQNLDPGLAGSDKVKQAQHNLTDYWFDHCAG